jgi:ribosomal protein S27AE
MVSEDTRTCPRCGAVVVLPDYCRIARDENSEQRATQVTRAVCGCWTAELSEEATLLLLGSLATGRANAKASVDTGVA